MNTLIIFDSKFGNTQIIATAIGKSLAHSKVKAVADVSSKDLKGLDLLLVGSPTQGGRATQNLQNFLEALPAGALTGTQVAAFDTRLSEATVKQWLKLLMKTIGYAAPKISRTLVAKGGTLFKQPEGFIVKDMEGPLANGEVQRAKKWIRYE